MPTKITIIHTRDFIRATDDGTLDADATRRLLKDVVHAIQTAEEHHVIIDTATTGRLSRSDLLGLGVAAGTHAANGRGKTALLVPFDENDDAKFFAAVARIEGANVRAFSDFEGAITWLIMRELSEV